MLNCKALPPRRPVDGASRRPIGYLRQDNLNRLPWWLTPTENRAAFDGSADGKPSTGADISVAYRSLYRSADWARGAVFTLTVQRNLSHAQQRMVTASKGNDSAAGT